MDASSFICALRHFFAIRGPVAKIRCDQGTNFVGGKWQLEDGTLGDGSDADPEVHGRARLRMGVQSSPCVTLRRCVGTPNRYGQTRIERNAYEDRTFPANARASGDAHGRSYWNRQQPPHRNNTF